MAQRGQLLIDVAQIVDLLIDGGQIVVVACRLEQHLQLGLQEEGEGEGYLVSLTLQLKSNS